MFFLFVLIACLCIRPKRKDTLHILQVNVVKSCYSCHDWNPSAVLCVCLCQCDAYAHSFPTEHVKVTANESSGEQDGEQLGRGLSDFVSSSFSGPAWCGRLIIAVSINSSLESYRNIMVCFS